LSVDVVEGYDGVTVGSVAVLRRRVASAYRSGDPSPSQTVANRGR
jgi:hypothetical protein